MIGIISLNWNTTDMMIRLYNSLEETTSYKHRMIIIDNGSKKSELDNLIEFFKDKENVFIGKLPENIGFAAGNNYGINLVVNEQYIFFINSDIVVQEKNWDLKMVEMLDTNGVGVVGCAYHPLKWSKDARFQIQPIPDHPVESESVQGAFFGTTMKILTEVYQQNGFYFDERFFFAHYEETSLCFEILEKKLKCFWMPIAHLHEHHRSSTKQNNYKLCKEIQNEQQFKANSEKNRQFLLLKHKNYFDKK